MISKVISKCMRAMVNASEHEMTVHPENSTSGSSTVDSEWDLLSNYVMFPLQDRGHHVAAQPTHTVLFSVNFATFISWPVLN